MNKIILFVLLGMSIVRTPVILSQTRNSNNPIFDINGVKFKMIHIDGGTFDMGPDVSEEERAYHWKESERQHNVCLGSYYISETEVTEDLWNEVMEIVAQKSTLPIRDVSWDECNKFINKLNEITGKSFRFPTEAEWEFAARGGNKSKKFIFSGSNFIDKIGWYAENSDETPHPVKSKKPNELGLFDMTGNVSEWCGDWTSVRDDYYLVSPWVNPKGYDKFYIYQSETVIADRRVVRGWNYTTHNTPSAPLCQMTIRDDCFPSYGLPTIGLRLAMDDKDNSDPMKNKISPGVTIDVDNEVFKMVLVKGGKFTMGYTKLDKTKCNGFYDDISDDNEIHEVTLTDFYIGETEVTQGLWAIVMGNNKDILEHYPIVGVSWHECQEFINKLNNMTGYEFRFPSEAEWEYAARGGQKTEGYLYSGSDRDIDVGWSWSNMKGSIQEVAQKKPNELGLYDMTGNVAEWCGDLYGHDYYGKSPKSNPQGPQGGTYKVCRGGLFNDDPRPNFYRMYQHPSLSEDDFIGWTVPYNGLRLAMTSATKGGK